MYNHTPPLLAKMLETSVGELVIRRDRIIEPRSGCCVARYFPTKEAAIAAAKEMNEVADWTGVLKTRAQDGMPNCQTELERIAEKHEGKLATGGGSLSAAICQRAVGR
jgi:hypothetical protein